MGKFKELFFEYLDFFVAIFMITLLTWILILSVIYWSNNIPYGSEAIEQFWWAGVGIAVFTVCAEWISGRLKAINRITKNLKRIRSEWR